VVKKYLRNVNKKKKRKNSPEKKPLKKKILGRKKP